MISLDCTLIETVPWSLLDLSGVTGRNHHLSMVVKNAYRPNYLFGEQVLVTTTITGLSYHRPTLYHPPGSFTSFEYLLQNLHIIDDQHGHLFKEKFNDEFVEVVSTLKEILESTPTPPGLEGYQTFYGNKEDYKLITKAVFEYRLPYGKSVSLSDHFAPYIKVHTEALTR